MPLTQLETVRTPEALESLCQTLRDAGRFALDTEFVGERTYIPRLCLVQVATTEVIGLVDTLAVRDMTPLWDLVCDPDVVKVLHAAREDLRLAFFGGNRRLPVRIFDTQVAAGLVGLPSYPLSYARLAEAIMGVKLSKAETRSEWDRRPLTPAQLDYARDDVRYLLPIQDKIAALLARLGRSAWMTEEMARFSEPRTYEVAPRKPTCACGMYAASAPARRPCCKPWRRGAKTRRGGAMSPRVRSCAMSFWWSWPSARRAA